MPSNIWQSEATRAACMFVVKIKEIYSGTMHLFSYADEDRNVVFKDCIHVTEIEERFDLKLCLHERDFIPGCSIAENIANAIRDSRKIVCVASINYLRSHWCMYEFNMALIESIHARDDSILILVVLSDIDIKKAPLSMMQFVRNNTYIEFPDDPTIIIYFGQNCPIHLNKPVY